MHAFTRPSQQLLPKVRHALLRSLHFISLYRRLILKTIEVGTNTQSVGKALHRRLMANASEGTTLLTFIYGQLYNGKLAHRYGHAPTDECLLCHKPDSCAHIAGECSFHKALTISLQNSACQLVLAAIRKSAKGGGVLHSAPDLVLVIADAGAHPQTSHVSLETLCSAQSTKESVDARTPHINMDWLNTLPINEATRIRRHTDVSRDQKSTLPGPFALHYDAECAVAPGRIPPWVLAAEEIHALLEEGHGRAPDLIYARESRTRPTPAKITSTRNHAPSSS